MMKLLQRLFPFLKPLPEGKRQCPHCGHEYEGDRRYCIGCGGQVWENVLNEDEN